MSRNKCPYCRKNKATVEDWTADNTAFIMPYLCVGGQQCALDTENLITDLIKAQNKLCDLLADAMGCLTELAGDYDEFDHEAYTRALVERVQAVLKKVGDYKC